METFAVIYVNYIEPGIKYFLMFMVVMLVLAFWSKAKEGKILDMAGAVFEGTLNYTYKTIYYIGLGVWLGLTFVARMFRVVFATVRDFFMSRI